MLEDIREIINDSDMVLVGLGEEFNDMSSLKKCPGYVEQKQKQEESGLLWLLPAYDESSRSRLEKRNEEIKDALNNLAEVLRDKNYFIVSTSFNSVIDDIPWKDGRLVTPCGGSRKKQCVEGCEEILPEVTETDENAIMTYIKGELGMPDLGKCPKCGKELILNNIYASNYNENGYLPQWQFYTKWLQGTLNKKLVILELGVGMKFPTVIRFPFEKVAFFNQKARLYRVNENLYQMSEELKEKGISISKNSIDWLRSM